MKNYTMRLTIRSFLCILLFLGIHDEAHMQSLQNASFEGEPQDARLPVGWTLCEEGTTPDILPGPWGVNLSASDGKTFVGLITRSDGSWESIGQRLSKPLRAGQCYQLTLDIAHDPVYAGYNDPGRLRIWLGDEICTKKKLIGDTEAFRQLEWKTMEFQFTPESEGQYILLESYFPQGEQIRTRSNILIDNIRKVKPCPRA